MDEDSRGAAECHGEVRDTMAGGTPRLSPYLHLGTLSPREIVERADRRRRGVDDFVRRCWVPELAELPGGAIHEPWAHDVEDLAYPAPLIDHHEDVARFRSARDLD